MIFFLVFGSLKILENLNNFACLSVQPRLVKLALRHHQVRLDKLCVCVGGGGGGGCASVCNCVWVRACEPMSREATLLR